MTDSEQDSIKTSHFNKELRAKLREQMEFYFSDSNLTKDRFLKKEIQTSSDGFIDLTVFLKFNKVRSLTTDLKQIIRSLKHSDQLELNQQQTMVRRRTAFVEPSQKDVDKKTIYVEDLPKNATNETIKAHLEQFGRVCYVSLPKYQTTGELKGFAFVEFEDKASAKRALKHFETESGGKMYDHTTIGKFPKFNSQIVNLERKISGLNQEISSLETELNPDNRVESQEDESAKKEKKSKEEKMDVDVDPIQDEWKLLKVISKKVWLQLKEDYLNRQKQEIDELKTKFSQLSKKFDDLKAQKEKKAQPPAKNYERGCIVKLTLDPNNDQHFKLLKMTRQQFKDAMLKEHDDLVAYVDVEKNSNRVLIRCKNADAANKLREQAKSLADLPKSVLEGEQEDEYFAKIDTSRSKKLAKKERKSANSTEPASKQSGTTLPTVVSKRAKEGSKDGAVGQKKIKTEVKSQHVKFDD